MATFLVVDDSKLSRIMLSEMLSELNYEVIGEACDGLEAISLYEKLKPDFVAMDIEMPNTNGIEATENILRKDPNASIMVITSTMDKKKTLIATKKGAKSVLNKPVSKNSLAAALAKLESGRKNYAE